MNHALKHITGLLALATLLSCGEGVGESGFVASLRIIHLSPDAPSLESYLDGVRPSEGNSVDFGQSTDYHGFSVGMHTLEVRNTGDAVVNYVDLGAIDFEAQAYTLVAVDESASLKAILFPDTHAPMADTDIRLRAIHAATGEGQIDFLAIAADGTATELSKNLDFGDFSESIDLAAGLHVIGIDLDNDLKAEAYFQPTDFPAGARVNIFYTLDASGEELVYAQLAADATEKVVAARSSLRVFHASSDAPNIDLGIGGTAALSNVAFGSSSESIEATSGSLDFEILSTGTSTALVMAADQVLLPNRAYTAVVYGDQTPDSGATSLRVDLIADDNQSIDGANVRFQIFHAAAGIEEGDVYSLNDQGGPVTNLVPDLGFGGYGSTPDLPKAKYSVGFEANASSLIIAEFNVPALTIEAANVFIIQDAADAIYLVAQLAGSSTALICEASAAGSCALP